MMSVEPIGTSTVVASTRDDDGALLSLWLHGRGPHTRRAYARDAGRFLAFAGKPLGYVALGDVQAFADELIAAGLAPATRARMLATVKSLLSFAHKTGYVTFDVGRPVKLPTVRNQLAERILTEAQVHRLLALESDPRNVVLLRLLYVAGLRVSEITSLRWRDTQPRDEAGQVTIFGKGGKTRAVLLPAVVWDELVSLRDDAGGDEPVFVSRKGGHLTERQVSRIVAAAATRAGIEGDVSPHWLRHAHASHALDRGAPIHLVQATLGHGSLATTSRYVHARPEDSSSRYLPV